MPPTDLDQEPTQLQGLAHERRARTARRLRHIGLLVLVAVIAVAAFVVFRSQAHGGIGEATSTTSKRTTTSSTTAVTTTTTLPPVPTSVPGITVGPLVGGPGPVPVIHRVPTTDPVVFITIDDGVTAEPDALNVIRDTKLPVTLFLNQIYLHRNGDYFRQLQDLGAVIGSHTTTHENLRGKDPAFQHGRICDLVPEFEGRFGTAPEMFRPPYGNFDPVTIQQAASCGIRYVLLWSAVGDSGNIVTAEGPLRAGDIILLHFKPGLGLRLRNIVSQIQAAGLRPARLIDYMRSAPPAPPSAPTTSVVALPETGAAVPPTG